MSWKKVFAEGEEVTLVSYSQESGPHANIVISRGFIDDAILLNDCQMKTTVENIKNNSKVCLVGKKDGEYFRIKGEATVYSEGKYLETAQERDIDYEVKNAIVVKVDSVFDLDKVCEVE